MMFLRAGSLSNLHNQSSTTFPKLDKSFADIKNEWIQQRENSIVSPRQYCKDLQQQYNQEMLQKFAVEDRPNVLQALLSLFKAAPASEEVIQKIGEQNYFNFLMCAWHLAIENERVNFTQTTPGIDANDFIAKLQEMAKKKPAFLAQYRKSGVAFVPKDLHASFGAGTTRTANAQANPAKATKTDNKAALSNLRPALVGSALLGLVGLAAITKGYVNITQNPVASQVPPQRAAIADQSTGSTAVSSSSETGAAHANNEPQPEVLPSDTTPSHSDTIVPFDTQRRDTLVPSQDVNTFHFIANSTDIYDNEPHTSFSRWLTNEDGSKPFLFKGFNPICNASTTFEAPSVNVTTAARNLVFGDQLQECFILEPSAHCPVPNVFTIAAPSTQATTKLPRAKGLIERFWRNFAKAQESKAGICSDKEFTVIQAGELVTIKGKYCQPQVCAATAHGKVVNDFVQAAIQTSPLSLAPHAILSLVALGVNGIKEACYNRRWKFSQQSTAKNAVLRVASFAADLAIIYFASGILKHYWGHGGVYNTIDDPNAFDLGGHLAYVIPLTAATVTPLLKSKNKAIKGAGLVMATAPAILLSNSFSCGHHTLPVYGAAFGLATTGILLAKDKIANSVINAFNVLKAGCVRAKELAMLENDLGYANLISQGLMSEYAKTVWAGYSLKGQIPVLTQALSEAKDTAPLVIAGAADELEAKANDLQNAHKIISNENNLASELRAAESSLVNLKNLHARIFTAQNALNNFNAQLTELERRRIAQARSIASEQIACQEIEAKTEAKIAELEKSIPNAVNKAKNKKTGGAQGKKAGDFAAAAIHKKINLKRQPLTEAKAKLDTEIKALADIESAVQELIKQRKFHVAHLNEVKTPSLESLDEELRVREDELNRLRARMSHLNNEKELLSQYEAKVKIAQEKYHAAICIVPAAKAALTTATQNLGKANTTAEQIKPRRDAANGNYDTASNRRQYARYVQASRPVGSTIELILAYLFKGCVKKIIKHTGSASISSTRSNTNGSCSSSSSSTPNLLDPSSPVLSAVAVISSTSSTTSSSSSSSMSTSSSSSTPQPVVGTGSVSASSSNPAGSGTSTSGSSSIVGVSNQNSSSSSSTLNPLDVPSTAKSNSSVVNNKKDWHAEADKLKQRYRNLLENHEGYAGKIQFLIGKFLNLSDLPEDAEQARIWLNKASKNGNSDAAELLLDIAAQSSSSTPQPVVGTGSVSASSSNPASSGTSTSSSSSIVGVSNQNSSSSSSTPNPLDVPNTAKKAPVGSTRQHEVKA